jgi:hypothetical protein
MNAAEEDIIEDCVCGFLVLLAIEGAHGHRKTLLKRGFESLTVPKSASSKRSAVSSYIPYMPI